MPRNPSGEAGCLGCLPLRGEADAIRRAFWRIWNELRGASRNVESADRKPGCYRLIENPVFSEHPPSPPPGQTSRRWALPVRRLSRQRHPLPAMRHCSRGIHEKKARQINGAHKMKPSGIGSARCALDVRVAWRRNRNVGLAPADVVAAREESCRGCDWFQSSVERCCFPGFICPRSVTRERPWERLAACPAAHWPGQSVVWE